MSLLCQVRSTYKAHQHEVLHRQTFKVLAHFCNLRHIDSTDFYKQVLFQAWVPILDAKWPIRQICFNLTIDI